MIRMMMGRLDDGQPTQIEEKNRKTNAICHDANPSTHRQTSQTVSVANDTNLLLVFCRRTNIRWIERSIDLSTANPIQLNSILTRNSSS
jgi:hypothetical protein